MDNQSDIDVGMQVPGISDFFDRRLFSLSEIYHENTKIRRTRYGQVFVACEPQLTTTPPAAKLHFAMTHSYKTYHTANSIALPKDLPPLTQSLEHVIRARRSVREFSGAPVTLEDLSRMLELSYGFTEAVADTAAPKLSRRVVPSAGALYPIEMYLVALNIEGLEAGLYHYHPKDQLLESLRAEELRSDIESAVLYPEIVSQASVVFLLAAIFQRTRFKYGERGYRFVLLDSGHIAQNIYLVSTALGLGAVSMGGYVDEDLNRMLDMNGVDESVVYTVVVGQPTGSLNG